MPTTKPGCKLGPGRLLILSRVKHKDVTRNFLRGVRFPPAKVHSLINEKGRGWDATRFFYEDFKRSEWYIYREISMRGF